MRIRMSVPFAFIVTIHWYAVRYYVTNLNKIFQSHALKICWPSNCE